mgnify:CR=1 FL=1
MSRNVDDIFNLILKASEVLKPVIHRTPVFHSAFFSSLTGKSVYLKLENLQKTGSFKVRGAYFKIHTLPEEVRAKGVITASSGNHAQGVAYAARELNIPSLIVMPETAPTYKINAVKSYGSEVLLYGQIYDDAFRKALELSEERGMALIHPFNDPYVIAGQGTIGLEIVEDINGVDTVIVPIGGGGLIAGIALAVKKLSNKRIKVVGVEPSAAAKTRLSLSAGRPVTVSPQPSLADGVITKSLGDLTFEIIRDYVDLIIEVEEDQIARAIYLLLERTKLLAEGAGALPIAALLSRSDEIPGKNVVAVVSGGNADLTTLYRILMRGLIREGRISRITLSLKDVPGSLEKVLKVLADLRCNILDISHDRFDLDIKPGYAKVKILMEVSSEQVIKEAIKKLRELGVEVFE